MRFLRLLPAGAALVLLVSACGGSDTTSDAAPQQRPSDLGSAVPSSSPTAAAPLSASPAPRATTAVSPTAVRTIAPSPAGTTAPSPKPSPQPSPRPSPKPSPRPSPPSSPLPPPGPTHNLDMAAGYRFSPMNLTIAVGDAVRAHNVDNMGHTFTGPTWDSGDVEPGQYSRVFRFNTRGTFNFICTPHEGLGMKGTLTVQ